MSMIDSFPPVGTSLVPASPAQVLPTQPRLPRLVPLSPSQASHASPPSQQEQQQRHAILHADVRVRLLDLLHEERHRVGVEDYWMVDLRVVCPRSLPDHEATVWWDAEVWYAQMQFRCDLPEALLHWDLLHELCELQTWRSANATLEMAGLLLGGETTERLLEAYKVGRNQEIELRVQSLLGKQRPAHLLYQSPMTSSSPPSSASASSAWLIE